MMIMTTAAPAVGVAAVGVAVPLTMRANDCRRPASARRGTRTPAYVTRQNSKRDCAHLTSVRCTLSRSTDIFKKPCRRTSTWCVLVRVIILGAINL